MKQTILSVTQGDYRLYRHREGDVVYCDPPYRGTDGYLQPFDHEAFYRWALAQPYPVFISEYVMPAGFAPIAERGKNVSVCATTTFRRVERLFVQERFAPMFARQLFPL